MGMDLTSKYGQKKVEEVSPEVEVKEESLFTPPSKEDTEMAQRLIFGATSLLNQRLNGEVEPIIAPWQFANWQNEIVKLSQALIKGVITYTELYEFIDGTINMPYIEEEPTQELNATQLREILDLLVTTIDESGMTIEEAFSENQVELSEEQKAKLIEGIKTKLEYLQDKRKVDSEYSEYVSSK